MGYKKTFTREWKEWRVIRDEEKEKKKAYDGGGYNLKTKGYHVGMEGGEKGIDKEWEIRDV